jgi:phage tail sheath protein FI
MAFNIGVNVVEVDGRATPTIVGAPISNAGFLVNSQRGVPNRPVRMGGMADYMSHFGGYTTAYGAHALRGFFENGGSTAYVVRVAGNATTPAAAASVTLPDRLGANTLTISAGSYGRADPGSWGNSLAVAVVDHPRASSLIPAQVLGTVSEPFALTSGQVLSVAVNGAPPVSVTLNSIDFAYIGAATAAEVAATINRQVSTMRAGVSTDRKVLLASGTPGPSSRLAVSGTAATPLGFTGASTNSDGSLAAGSTTAALSAVAGLEAGSALRFEVRGHVVAPNPMAAAFTAGSGINVAVDGGAPVLVSFQASDFVNGVGAITPGEVVAAINRQATGFRAALTSDNRLALLSNSYGPSSSVGVTAPASDATAALGLAGSAPVNGSRQFIALTWVSERYRIVAWNWAFSAVPALAGRIQSAEFDLVIRQSGVEVERFESLSMQTGLGSFAPTVVNDQASGSRFITGAQVANASGPGQNIPALTAGLGVGLTAGADGGTPRDIDYIGDPAARTGLHAFDTVAIQLLACPETTSAAVVEGALAYCESRGDAMFVGTAPRDYPLEAVKSYASGLRARKVYGALYAPWISIVDATGQNPTILVPPVGHVLGVYARLGDARGVWKAPAGDEAQILGALGVAFPMSDVDHTDLVKNGGVNGIRAIPGAGVIIDASRTLSTDTRWLFVNVRRLFNYVKVSLRDGLRWVAQEPHSDDLRRSVKFNVVNPFLLGLWRQGAFGSDPADKVFTVKCDAENNPPSQVNLGMFTLEVYFYPVKPAETIVIIVGQQQSGAAASEH